MVSIVENPPEECVIWPWRSVTSTGYGTMKFRGKQTKAHHVSLILSGKERPPGLQVRHLCNVPMCVNSQHLAWGTPKENQADRIVAGTTCQGENSPSAKLTEVQVQEIREALACGEVQQVIADFYGVSQTSISYIKNGKRWREAS